MLINYMFISMVTSFPYFFPIVLWWEILEFTKQTIVVVSTFD